jgi:hypothetical protein
MHDVLVRAVKIDVLEEYDMRHHNLSLLCDERARRSELDPENETVG